MNRNQEIICNNLKSTVATAIKAGVSLDYITELRHKNINELLAEKENVSKLISHVMRDEKPKKELKTLNAQFDLCGTAISLKRRDLATKNSGLICKVNDNVSGLAWAIAIIDAQKTIKSQQISHLIQEQKQK